MSSSPPQSAFERADDIHATPICPGTIRLAAHTSRGGRVLSGEARGPLILLSHSAAGKSTLLSALGLDRDTLDMDVVCARDDLRPTIRTLLGMLRQSPEAPLAVCSNALTLLAQLAHASRPNSARQLAVVYLRRSCAQVYRQYQLRNADGLWHQRMEYAEFETWYAEFERIYKAAADLEIETSDETNDGLVDVVTRLIQRTTSGAATRPRCRIARAEAMLSDHGTAIDPRSLLFDSDWYRQCHPDVAAAGTDPALHFLTYGFREGRSPNPHFDITWYLEQNPDVASSWDNPFTHYLFLGAREGRKPRP